MKELRKIVPVDGVKANNRFAESHPKEFRLANRELIWILIYALDELEKDKCDCELGLSVRLHNGKEENDPCYYELLIRKSDNNEPITLPK